MSSSTATVTQAARDQPEAISFPTAILEVEDSEPHILVSKSRTVAIISCVTCITAISNLLAGLLTVSIPVISADLGIPAALQLWPASAFALACGCTLLLCGTVTDALGCRRICLVGAVVQACSAIGSGLAATTSQLIAARTIAGVAASLCLPSAVGIISRSFPVTSRPGSRSAAFSAMGGGQAVGFGLGLVLGGVFSDNIGWRWGFHTTAILNGAVFALALWALPPGIDGGAFEWAMVTRLPAQIDWIGAAIVSTSLALLSYQLAVFSGTYADRHIREPLNIVLLSIALILIPTFGLWMHFQTKRDKPALIPNSLWTNVPFTTVCATVFLVWGALNASEQLTALYLQDVRGISALTSSLYFLPAPICGALMNAAVAVVLPRLNLSYAVATGCLVSGIAPLLLATLCRVNSPSYWEGIFQAMALNPLGAALIYVIANLVVTAAFPPKMQALAGGVFHMLSQIGKSFGIATTAVIAQQISGSPQGDHLKEAVLQGYKAGWWYNCGMSFVSVLVSFWGLRNVGKLGVKRD